MVNIVNITLSCWFYGNLNNQKPYAGNMHIFGKVCIFTLTILDIYVTLMGRIMYMWLALCA